MKHLLVALLLVAGLLQSAAAAPIVATPVNGRPVVPMSVSSRQIAHPNVIGLDSPLSSSVLVARALRTGRIRLPNRYFFQPFNYPLSCSPAPCRLPNVQASEGGQPANETPIAMDPSNPSHLLSGANDYNCSNTQGFYASTDGGKHWNATCLGNVTGAGGVGDPGVGYDTGGTAYITGIDEYSGTDAVIIIEKSKDDGKTWSQPHIAVMGISPYDFTDKDWLQIDTSKSSPHKDALYISTTGFDASSNSSINVAHSKDGGRSWTNVMVDAVNVPEIDQFSDLGIAA